MSEKEITSDFDMDLKMMKNEIRIENINGSNVYHIDVGDMSPEQVTKYLSKIRDEIRNKKIPDNEINT